MKAPRQALVSAPDVVGAGGAPHPEHDVEIHVERAADRDPTVQYEI
jgi:hypothetical protein